ncbi:MAG TPA: hypothetical protein PLW81_09615 [Thiobacillaceae bacterium]|nr:hypothetical protein [Thiobacillaceae bacterium]
MRNGNRISPAARLAAVFGLMLLVMAAQAETLRAERSEITVGETLTLYIEGASGMVRPKWQTSPEGILSFQDRGNIKAVVKGLKPGRVTVTAKVPGLFGSSLHSRDLSVLDAAAGRGRSEGQTSSGAAESGQGSGSGQPQAGSLGESDMKRIGDLIKQYEGELRKAGLLDRFGKQEADTEKARPRLTDAEARNLGDISEAFLRDLSRQGYSLQTLQRFKSQFMAAGSGGSPLFPGQGGWNDAFLATERAIMMGRAQLVQRLWMETLQDTFKANPDAAVFGEIDIGSWVKMQLSGLGFEADIDLSSVALDPDLNRWIVDNFQNKLGGHIKLDMVKADALLTAHGQATPDVFIGDWGKTFAELDMLKRSKWKLIRVEKDGKGNLILDENGKPKIRMVERAGAHLFWEVAFRKMEAQQKLYSKKQPHELPFPDEFLVDHPKMGLDKEPMLSLEMLRHGIHDIEHGPYSRGQKLIKMLKYAERSYFMNKKALAAHGFDPYADSGDTALADAATRIIANKNDPAMVADLLQALAGKEITEDNVDAVTDELVARAKTAMHDNAARALAFRLRDIAKIDADDARQKAAEKLWQDLGTELDTFRGTSGEPPHLLVQAQEMAQAVMEGKLSPADLEAKANDLHKLLNEAYKLPDQVISRILMSDAYFKVKAYLKEKGWDQKSIDEFVRKAREKYPNAAQFYDKFTEFNDQLNKTTAGSGLLKAADFADNAFTVYEAYLGSSADEALWNASLALGRVGLQESFPSLQIPLALYDSVRTGSPKPLGMAVVFMYFPFAGQTYMVSQMMGRADVAIRDAEFYAGLNMVLEITEFDTQGKITGFSLKNILGKEIDSETISPPGNRKAIVALFTKPESTFYVSPNFRYWSSLVPKQDDRFGRYENKLQNLRRFFALSEDVAYMTHMLENFKTQSGKMPQDKYTAQRQAALAGMEDQLTETLWVAMADMLESAAQSVQTPELDAKVRKVEEELNLGDDDLGRNKGILSKIKWEIRQNSSLFSGENPYAVGLIYDKYLKAYERVSALRRQIVLDIWNGNLGIDYVAAQSKPMKLLLMGGKSGAPALTGDPAADVDLAEKALAAHQAAAAGVRADLASALGRTVDDKQDKDHLKALGQLGLEREHLLDDCAARAAPNCDATVRSALQERVRQYKEYLAKLSAGLQPIQMAIDGPTELKPGDSVTFSVRFAKAEDRSRPGLALRWTVDGQARGNGEKLGLKAEKAGSLSIGLTAWVGVDKEVRKLGETSRTITVKDGKDDKPGANAKLAADIEGALKAKDWKRLADMLAKVKQDTDRRIKQTEAWQADVDALMAALESLKKERMAWALAWKDYMEALSSIDSRTWDKLTRAVDRQKELAMERCYKGASPGEDPRKRESRCTNEGIKFYDSCLGDWPKRHFEESKRIRVAMQELPDAVHLLHSAGYFSHKDWFEAVEKMADKYKLPFPYPNPVKPRLAYAAGCASVDLPTDKKKPEDTGAFSVRVQVPSAIVPFGKAITATASPTGGRPPHTYHWSVAGGSGARASFTPQWAGEWTVSVTVTDADGKSGEGSASVQVSPMKVKLVGAKGQVFYGSQARLSTEGLGLEMPAPEPVPDPCAGKPRGTNPFDECGKIEVTAPPVSTCPADDPFCVNTSHPGVRSYGDLPPVQEGMVHDPNLVRALPESGPAPTGQAPKPSEYQFVWQAEPGLTFDQPKGDKPFTKVIYDRMGQVKVWCEVLKFEEGAFHTVGECDQATVNVVAPAFSVSFAPPDGQARVGQEVRARINTQPSVKPDLIQYRWLDPGTANRMEYTDNAGEIGFKVKDAKTLVLKALARVPGYGDEIGTVDATYTGAVYEVKAWVVEPGTRPMMWDAKKGGLVPVPKGSYATFERIGLRAEVQGGAPDGVRWNWTVNDGTSISNPISQTPTVSRSEAGGISARVTARDKDGAELGNAEVSLSVIQVSDQPPKPTPAEEKENKQKQKQAEARKLAKQAEDQLKRGDLPGAAQSARQARDLDPATAGPTARKVADAAKKAGWQGVYDRDFKQVVPHLETAVDLNPDDKDARDKLERARRFVQVWPQVEAKAREFDAQMAEKKYFSAHKSILAMQDLQREMPGVTQNALPNRVMKDFDAGMKEYNTFMNQVQETHRRSFKEEDWQVMLDNAQQALNREHSPENEKMLRGNAEFARQQLAQRAAETAKHGKTVAGTWAINGNGYQGKLEISEQDGKLSGRVWYDIHGRWEALRDVSFNGRNLVFTRPIPGATQRYTGAVAGKEFRGTFSQEGTATLYNWSAKRSDAAEPAVDIRLPPGLALATDKAAYPVGETITLRWGGIGQPAAQDWIGLYAEGAANEKYGEWHYLKAQAGGTLQFKAPQQPGAYEFRLFLNWPAGGYKDVARSPRIRVGAAGDAAPAGSPSTGAQTAAVPVGPGGLIAAYALDGDARDGSGNGRHGTLNGVVPTADRFGRANGAMAFNGKAWIELPIDINPGALPQLSFTAWVRADEANPVRQVMSHDNGGYDRSLGIDYRGGGNGWSVFTGSSAVLGVQAVEIGRWTFVAGVWDQAARKVRLHVDDRTFEKSGESGGGHATLSLGRNPSYGEYLVGAMDDVRLYGRVLSLGEIAAIRGEAGVARDNAYSGPAANVAGKWKTSEGELTLNQAGNKVTGSYANDGGEIEGEVRGNVLEGVWIENSSGQNCGVARNGRKHWGRIRWVFDGNRFVGGWSYCEGAVGPEDRRWTGERIGAAPAAVPASPATSSTPTGDAAKSLDQSVDDLKKSLKDLKGLFNW